MITWRGLVEQAKLDAGLATDSVCGPSAEQEDLDELRQAHTSLRSAFATQEVDCFLLTRRLATLTGLNTYDCAIPPSTAVVLHSLSSDAFNGQQGICVGFDTPSGRYKVELESCGSVKKFKPINVTALCMRKFA
eukprot:1716903-Karenia_brevis.AAC.1